MTSVIKPYKVIEGGDMSGNLVSEPTDVHRFNVISYQVIYDDAPVGEFFVEGSIDGQTWTPLKFDARLMTADATTGSIFSVTDLTVSQTRLRYASVSGTGSLTAFAIAKRIGG